uniref:Glycosyl transferase family 28 C-terminal domain-containing protein n=1 Tax=Aegilops tauschii subsp. strangulata TaxID=200361 RepID=A0A453IW49_AEGTS
TLFDSWPEMDNDISSCNKIYLPYASIGRYILYVIDKEVSGNLNLQVEHFTFLPSIADSIREASLVISHAGSGSIFETLRLGKPLIVVVNEDLMDNHQSELAEELAEQNHLLCAHPQTLRETVEAMDLHALQPYIPGEARPVVALINEFLGFPVD